MPATATDRLYGVTTSVAIKPPCLVATTTNITLSGLQTIDGVVLAADDRVLVKNQTSTSANGIYEASTSGWSRAPDFDGARDAVSGTLVIVRSGSTNSNTIWELTTANPVVIGTDALVFQKAVISDSAAAAFIAAGIGAVTRTAQDKMRESLSVKDFGAVGDGITDDTAAEDRAIAAAAVGSIKRVFYPSGTYKRTAPYAFTSVHAGIELCGDGAGASVILKAFSGTLGTVASCPHLKASGMHFNGNLAAFPGGKGFVFSGTSHYPFFDQSNFFESFDSTVFEFGADSGFRANISAVIFNSTGSTRAVHITGPDTTAMFRNFSGMSTNGYVQVTGGLDTTFNNGYCAYMVIDSTSSITKSVGTIWGAGAVPIVIDGQNTIIVGCRLAQTVTLNVGMTGVFSGNQQTVAGFTDNTVPGNVLVQHHSPGAGFNVHGKNRMSLAWTLGGEIQVGYANSVSDADFSWLPDNSPTRLVYSVALTADRTITLNTANCRMGMTLRVVRSAAGAFNLNVGGLKTLAANTWCEVHFNGAAWALIGYGTL